MTHPDRIFSASLLAGTGLMIGLAPSMASANVVSLPGCNGNCNWSVQVDGADVLSGTYSILDDGALVVTPTDVLSAMLDDGGEVWLTDLYGNADPILGFSLAASTVATGRTFAYSFSLPIALSGLIYADSSVSYSLTGTTAGIHRVTPLFGNVVVGQEIDTDGPLGVLNKGVDVGDLFGFTGIGTQNSPVYTATNFLTGDLGYDLMGVTVAFALSAGSNVGMSGYVQQVPAPVPLPAALPLLLSGFGGLLGFARFGRRRS